MTNNSAFYVKSHKLSKEKKSQMQFFLLATKSENRSHESSIWQRKPLIIPSLTEGSTLNIFEYSTTRPSYTPTCQIVMHSGGPPKYGWKLIVKAGTFYEVIALHPGFFAVRFTRVHGNHKLEGLLASIRSGPNIT